MNTLLNLLASDISDIVKTPDTGVTALLLGAGVLALGMFARFLKNRKK